MKFVRSVFSLIMSLIILLTMSSANMSFASSTSTDTTLRENSNISSEPVEITELRNANSKTFLLADGTYRYVGYAEPVHYRNAAGTFDEIDNTIVLSTSRANYTYTNTANYWKTYFKESLNDENAVMLVRDNYQISFSMPTTNDSTVLKASEISNLVTSLSASKNTAISELSTEYFETLSTDTRAVLYRDVLPGIDVSYTVGTNTLKEDIILKKATGVNSFSFTVNAGGLSVVAADNVVSFVDNSGNEIFRLAPLYMVDAAGKRSEELAYAIASNGTKYTLTITADTSFLNSADTQYPVVIDPSVMVTGSDVTFDTCVDQEYPTSNYYLSENLWTGGALGTNAMRTYMLFAMPNGVSASQVTSAYVYLLKKEHQVPTIKAYRVLNSWSSSTITWNTKAAYSYSDVSDAAVNTVGDWYGLNVTAMVKKWLDGTYINHGMVLKEPSETNSSQKTKFYSSDAPSPNKPELVINYYSSNLNARLIAVTATNHDHLSCLNSAKAYLEQCNLNNIYINSGSFDESTIQSYLDSNSNGLFISRSHGDIVTSSNNTQIGTCICLDDANYYIRLTSNSSLSSLDLSNMCLILFIGCYTGAGGINGKNLPAEAVKRGATTAIGFSDSIGCSTANSWTISFARYMSGGSNVQATCEALGALATYSGTPLATPVVCGYKYTNLT